MGWTDIDTAGRAPEAGARRFGGLRLAALVLAASLVLTPRGAVALEPGRDGACPLPPAVAPEIVAKAPYKKGEIPKDKEALTFNKTSLANLNDFIARIERLADEAVGGSPGAADCFGTTMDRWIATDPLTRPTSDQAGYEQQWALGSIALAVLKAQAGGARLSPEAGRWLRTVAAQVRAFHEARRTDNNHAAWGALGVGAAAYVLHDEDAWRWAMARQAIVIDQIQEDGVLPREMLRGPRATNYHFFAAMPLIALNLVRACRGGLAAGERDRMERLQALLRTTGRDPQFLAGRASAEQFPPNKMPVIAALNGAQSASDPLLGGDIGNLRKALARCR